jgi:NADH-quinone oxidoreductase subunit G
MPGEGGMNAGQMLSGALKAVILLNAEPEFDSAAGRNAKAALEQAEMVVTLSPFKANMEFSDVLLPIAPWTETPGTFVNAEGRVQSFHAVVKPLADTRPGWKVLRVLGNMLGLAGFDYESAQEVLVAARGEADAQQAFVQGGLLSNKTSAAIDMNVQASKPTTAAIYQLDPIVRRAPALQLTADAQAARAPQEGVPA